MLCYRIQVPVGTKLAGVTADGKPTAVLPGEYVAHLLPPKVRVGEPIARIVGADPMCRDVHVPLQAVKNLLARIANDAHAMEDAAA